MPVSLDRGGVSNGFRLELGDEGAPEAPTSEQETLESLDLKIEVKESSREASEASGLDLSGGPGFEGEGETDEFALPEGQEVADEVDDLPESILIPELELMGGDEEPEGLPARMALGNRGKSTVTQSHLVESSRTGNNGLPSSLACNGQAPKLEIPGLKQAPQHELAALRPDENLSEITKWMFGIVIFLVGLGLALWTNYNLLGSFILASYASLGATHGVSYLLTRRHSRMP